MATRTRKATTHTTPADTNSPDSATRLHKALTVLHKTLGQPAPGEATSMPPVPVSKPLASLPGRPAPDQAVASLAGTYAALEAYAASPRGKDGDTDADREPFDELAEYRERRPAVQSIPHTPAARPTLASEMDADGPEDGQSALILDHSNLDVTRHDGILTLFNPATGNHRTFSIETVRNEASGLFGKRIVSLLIGPNRDLYTNWKGFAFVTDEGLKVWRKFVGTMKKSEYEVFASMLENPARFAAKGVEYKMEAHCRRCGRSLSRPDSIDTGYGATCRAKAGL